MVTRTEELGRFFDFIYGAETGYAYSPTKNPQTESWEQHFFKWPTERDKLIHHVIDKTSTYEVYSSPALFNGPNRAEKKDFKGTKFIWCEFDGELPITNDSLPEPTIKVQSSEDGHEHWYWKLDQFETNKKAFEEISQRLTYHLNADLGCWNINRVLRPPTTIHHESNLTVKVLHWDSTEVSLGAFTDLPPLPVKFLDESDVKKIPPAVKVLGKYSWDDDFLKLFLAETIKKGGRSSALTKLGHFCIEKGCSNSETLGILLSADNRWGKFSKRNDQKKQLLSLINYCRSRHPVDPVAEESTLKVYTFNEFINTEIKIEWVVPNLLHKKGVLSVSGPPGVGKSQFSLRFAESLAKGEKFLKWNPNKPCRTIFVSMEMPHEELLFFIDMMKMQDSNGFLEENFMMLPLGHSLRMNTKTAQEELNKVMEKYQPTGVIFDSLGKGIGEDIGSEGAMLEAFEYIDHRIRGDYGAFAWIIHHPRKGQVGNKKPNTLDDLYGSTYLGANVTTALSLWPSTNDIEISCLKMRMSAQFDPFHIARTPNLNFKVKDTSPFKKTEEVDGLGESL